MCTISKSRVTGALCIVLASTAFAANASATPINIVSSPVIQAPSLTEPVYYRRSYHRNYGHYRHYRHYGYGYQPYYNPAGQAAGAAVELGTLPLRAVFGNPYY